MSFPKPFKEFDVSYSFSQRIHVLRKKLNHARCILENTQNTLASIRLHTKKVAQIGDLPALQIESLQYEFENISIELSSHLLTTCKLLRFSEDIRLMVPSFFPFGQHVVEICWRQNTDCTILSYRIMIF